MTPPPSLLQLPTASEWSTFTTVLVGPSEAQFIVHTHVLRRITWFVKCLDGGMKETQENIIRLPEDSPLVFSQFVRWLHSGQLDFDLVELSTDLNRDNESEDNQTPPDDKGEAVQIDRRKFHEGLEIMVGIYLLAQKFDVEELQNFAVNNIQKALEDEWLSEAFQKAVYALPKDDNLHRMVLQDIAHTFSHCSPAGENKHMGVV